VALTCAGSLVRAADTPASEESIREILQITDARKLVEGMFGQMDGLMRNSMQQVLKGQPATAEQQKIIEKMQAKTMAAMREELSWEKLESLYITVYQKTFTQEELDGMIAFYRTPAGAAMIKKMPLLMQETMTMMQQRMGPMMKSVQKAVQETAEEIRAEQRKEN
jgi:hypothetical protein